MEKISKREREILSIEIVKSITENIKNGINFICSKKPEKQNIFAITDIYEKEIIGSIYFEMNEDKEFKAILKYKLDSIRNEEDEKYEMTFTYTDLKTSMNLNINLMTQNIKFLMDINRTINHISEYMEEKPF